MLIYTLKSAKLELREWDVAGGQQNGPTARTISSRQLLPVRIESNAPAAPVRILLPQGFAIETSARIDDGTLSNLVRALREVTVC